MQAEKQRRRYILAWVAVLLTALVWFAQFVARASPGSVPRTPVSPLAAFDGDAPVATRSEWTSRRAPLLRQAFLARVYGELPSYPVNNVGYESIDRYALGGAARLELVTLRLGTRQTATALHVALFTPPRDAPVPLIIMSDFCGLDADLDHRLPSPSWRAPRCRSILGRALTQISHGDAILQPPLRSMIERGYAVAVFYPSEIAPDDPVLFGEAPIRDITAGHEGGAVAAWASLYLSVFEVMRADSRVAPSQIALWGHSRFGKAALLAAALEPQVGAIIANQSGTFGATLSSATRGESVMQIMQRFPHWFPMLPEMQAYRTGADGFDQHMLLALLAPRPVLLGNARLDRWSDPAASFAAARGASDAYALFGRTGLNQEHMRSPNLESDIAFYVRPGGHGVRSSDWSRALDFLDIHFAPESAVAGGA